MGWSYPAPVACASRGRRTFLARVALAQLTASGEPRRTRTSTSSSCCPYEVQRRRKGGRWRNQGRLFISLTDIAARLGGIRTRSNYDVLRKKLRRLTSDEGRTYTSYVVVVLRSPSSVCTPYMAIGKRGITRRALITRRCLRS